MRYSTKCAGILTALVLALAITGCSSQPADSGNSGERPDITIAVKAAAEKDCGCGECSAAGCKPCHGKNCYYCVAKGLMVMECGCGECSPKGCKCGPGCDVCKFHLAPVEAAKTKK